jgi:hypothetical protein
MKSSTSRNVYTSLPLLVGDQAQMTDSVCRRWLSLKYHAT